LSSGARHGERSDAKEKRNSFRFAARHDFGKSVRRTNQQDQREKRKEHGRDGLVGTRQFGSDEHLMWKFRERRTYMGVVPILLLLSGCGAAEPDCNSADSRAAVIGIVSGDPHNALVDYAVKNSDALKTREKAAGTNADKSAMLEKARQSAVYRLSETIATNSKSKDKRSLTCSGTMFVTVEGDIVQKQVDFKVDQPADGKPAVTVSAFQFDPNEGQR
jgi:hypothetical protein